MAPRLLPLRPRRFGRGAALAMVLMAAAGASVAQETTPEPSDASLTIVAARYDGPTERYGHAVLGDAIEYTTLVIEAEDWSHRYRVSIELPTDHVFEDIEPRLWDVTGDGRPEVVVIETDMALGGSLAIYDMTGKIAETPHIGRTNRWLAPVAAADFDGDGAIEIGFVDRPHLAKTLRVFEYRDGALILDQELAGLTNHRIGEDFITGGLRSCGERPEMVTANADWSAVMVTGWTEAGWRSQPAGAFSGSLVRDVLACR